MIYFLTRLVLAIFGAVATGIVYSWIIVPDMLSTVLTVIPFLLLSIVAYIYLQQTGSLLAASIAYLIGLFPFTLWIYAIHVIFRNTPGTNDELAGILLTSYLVTAAGAYLCLIFSRSRVQPRKFDRKKAV